MAQGSQCDKPNLLNLYELLIWVCCWLWTLCHTTQHGAVLIIFLLNLQTITITRMLSSGGSGTEMDLPDHVCHRKDGRMRFYSLLLLWHWAWSDDLDEGTWSEDSEDVPAYQNKLIKSRLFNVRTLQADTCTITTTTTTTTTTTATYY